MKIPMKKLLSLFSVLVLLSVFSGCQKKDTAMSETSTATVTISDGRSDSSSATITILEGRSADSDAAVEIAPAPVEVDVMVE